MEIIIKNLIYSYKNKKLIDKLNLKIEDNKITGITGPNKTVLCRLLDGVGNITSGSIMIGLEEVNKKNLKHIRNRVSMIHQDYSSQFFTDSVLEEVMFLINRLDYKPKNINKKIDKSLDIVGLDKKVLDKSISNLTSGEKKLLQIAISLIYNPDIIIFDEVFVSLDKINRKKIMRLIRTLKDKYNKTIIISSNDVNMLYEITDNIVILGNKNVLYTGNTKEVYQEKEVIEDKKIDVPDLVRFTYLAKNKKVKLSYHTDILDLIKDVYKHV